MTILITGGNGFIGSHLAEALIKKGENITLFDLKFGKNTKDIDCEKIQGDVKNFEDVKKAVSGKDLIFHLAAVSRVVEGQKNPYDCLLTNAFGTLNVSEAMRKVCLESICFLGSSREVYGEPEKLPVAENHPKRPLSIYGFSKLMAENICSSYYRHFGVRFVIFRFSNVYGSERDLPDRVIPKFVMKALKGEPLSLYGGEQVLDFTHIEDVVEGILKAREKCDEIIAEDFLLTTGRGTSIRELAEKLKEICNSNSPIRLENKRLFDVKRFIGSYDKANKHLRYKPKIRLEDGLKKTIARFASFGK